MLECSVLCVAKSWESAWRTHKPQLFQFLIDGTNAPVCPYLCTSFTQTCGRLYRYISGYGIHFCSSADLGAQNSAQVEYHL